MKPDRVGAVVNPHAGSGDAASLFVTLAECFPDAEVDAEITTGPDHVPVAAVEQAARSDLIVAVGGDGTLREVAAALVEAESETPLFVVPAGRGNSTYRHLYGDDDWRELARGLSTGIDARPLEVGRIESTPPVSQTHFVLGFTAGLFRSALDTAERLRGLPGPVAYLLATAGAAVADDPVDVSVAVDDEPLFEGPARLVAVGGGRYRGSDFELLPESRPGDGTLHALAVEPTDLRDSLALLRSARAGRLLEHPAVSYRTGTTVTVESEAAVPVEVDGTPVDTPLESARLSVVPAAVSVAYPTDGG
ncbi:diacylglycerol/lipid kinase family protein [Natronomonas marina]|jgi:diacylglycerol kinase (ATP)|uniref:diacylglycerol/lipid kinase family protein n=1 Tax=Natronomonas marina TaxID=2961939 RepID=UPI0020C9B9FA|nr:diacylglycerol kinase family protein [Natronomonas marina]